MKQLWKTAAALLLCAALAACGQGGSDTPPAPAQEAPPRLMTQARSALRESRAGDLSIGGSRFTDPNSSVLVTDRLLEDISRLLEEATLEETDMNGISGSGIHQLMMQGQTPQGYLMLDFYRCPADHDLYPGRTVVWLQYGEEMGQYLADGSLYDQIAALAADNLRENAVSLAGHNVRLQFSSPYGRIKGEGFVFQDALNLDGVLLFSFYHSTRDLTRLEGVLPEDGRSLFTLEEAGFCRIEALPQKTAAGYDYALYTPAGMTLRSSANANAAEAHPLPADLLGLLEQLHPTEHPGENFSIHPQSGMAALTNDTGLWYGSLSGGAPRLLVGSQGLHRIMGVEEDRFQSPVEGVPALMLRQPRILCGGRRVVATVVAPGSQSGNVALLCYDLEQGTIQCYDDVFAAMMASVDYPDDNTVAALGDGVTLIDLATGQITTAAGVPILERSADYRTFVGVSSSAGEDGVSLHQLYAYRPEESGSRTTLLTATGDRFYLMDVVEGYALCVCDDSAGADVVAISTALE